MFIADFHIHSKYSRATSKEMDIDNLARWAKIKGINLLGTGDFTHPDWLKGLKEKLKEIEYGIYEHGNVFYMLTSEVSNIYFKTGKIRKIHNIIFAPSFEIVEEINSFLSQHGNLYSDGRAMLRIESDKMVKGLYKINKDIFVVPAHVWTPHFSLFGANSGFDSIEECFGEQTAKIFSIETGLSCYDDETEVLSKDGWKKFSKVHSRDELCTLNIRTNEIEFQTPTKVFTYKYKGRMYRLKTKRVDLLVTPNHKLLYSPCDFRNRKPYSLKEAELLFGKSKIFKKDGIWVGRDPKYFILPAVNIRHGSRYYSGNRVKKKKEIPIKPWLKFFGFWLAEGWVSEGKNGDYNVCVSNRNQNLLNEIERILNGFGYRTFRGDDIIRVRNFQLFHYLKKFGKCYNKFIPVEIKALSKELLEILFEYYIKGDGHIYGRTKKGLSATTTSIRLRDDLQEIALKMGISAYYKLGYRKGKVFISPGCKKLYKQRNDSWIIFFIRRNRPIILPSTIKKHNYTESWVNYDGLVFCVTVPNHVIYIRRNGIPLWCGNSDPAMNWRWSKLDTFSLMSNSDAHSPSKIGREANVFKEKFGYKELIDILKTKNSEKFLYTVEFYPQEGKYHWDGHRKCNARLSPQESRNLNYRCPTCGAKVTIGVMQRVEKLGDRSEGFILESAPGYKNLVPLIEIIASALGMGSESQAVEREYNNLIAKFGNEFKVLLEAQDRKINEECQPKIANGILNARKGNVEIIPGYDGVYGKVSVRKSEEGKKEKQLELF